MVNATGAQAPLRNFKAPAPAKYDVAFRHANIVKFNVHVAMRRIVLAKYMHGSHYLDTLGIHRHQYL